MPALTDQHQLLLVAALICILGILLVRSGRRPRSKSKPQPKSPFDELVSLEKLLVEIGSRVESENARASERTDAPQAKLAEYKEQTEQLDERLVSVVEVRHQLEQLSARVEAMASTWSTGQLGDVGTFADDLEKKIERLENALPDVESTAERLPQIMQRLAACEAAISSHASAEGTVGMLRRMEQRVQQAQLDFKVLRPGGNKPNIFDRVEQLAEEVSVLEEESYDLNPDFQAQRLENL
jgi:DNA repair exonuclease SbcCD ATPase subunit